MSKTVNTIYSQSGPAASITVYIDATKRSATGVSAASGLNVVQFTYQSTTGAWFAKLPAIGTWIVTATDGVASNRATVEVTGLLPYTVTIKMPWLPDEYTELTYISGQSSSTTYISTGIYVSDGNKIEATVAMPNVTTTLSAAFFWVAGSNNTRVTQAFGTVSRSLVYAYSSTSVQYVNLPTISSRITNNNLKVSAEYLTISINGTAYTVSYGATVTSPEYSIRLGVGTSYSDLIRRWSYFRVLSADGVNYVANMIPAKKNSNNKVGFYDVVRMSFYDTSADEIAGPSVIY